MRIRLVAAAAAVALCTPASAGPPFDATVLAYGCSLAAVTDTTQTLNPAEPRHYEGVVRGYAAAYSPTLGHNPVEVSITCTLRYEGIDVPIVAPMSPVATAVASPVSFDVRESEVEWMQLCMDLRVEDAHGQTDTEHEGCWTTPFRVIVAPGEAREAIDPACVAARPACDVLDANQVELLTMG